MAPALGIEQEVEALWEAEEGGVGCSPMLTFPGVPAADQRTQISFPVTLLRAQLLSSVGDEDVPRNTVSSKRPKVAEEP